MSRYDDETAEIEDVWATDLSKSGKALCCKIGDMDYWIPISVIHDDSEVWKMGQKGKLVLKAWFAIKEGLV